jgi:hypothetical protein
MSEYPDEEELLTIEKWDTKDPWGLAEYLINVWHYEDYIRMGKRWVKGRYEGGYKKFEISTAGWSGNEDRIDALQKNHFWFFWWHSSERGGHYVFQLPKFYHPDFRKELIAPNK